MKSVFARHLYTGNALRENVYINYSKRTVTGVSKKARGERIGEYPVVTPAFIDPHSHIGLIRSGEPEQEGDGNETMAPITAFSDALDAIQMDDAAFQDAIEMGVLYSCVMPGSGNILGGRSAVIRHFAGHSSQALVARAGIKAAFGYNPTSTTDWKGKRPSTRMGAVGMLREQLTDVSQKMERFQKASARKKQDIRFTAPEEVLRALLDGRERLRVHVHKIDDIAAVLRLIDEFDLDVTIEHAMDVHHPEIFRDLKRRRIPVVYGPIDSFAYKVELKHEQWRNIRHLLSSDVDLGLMTDHPVVPARNLLMQTRWFLRNGWSRQAALELVSRRNAEILGIDDRVGTLRRGRWASFVCWNGDPFDLSRYPVAVFGEGELLFQAESS